MRSWVVLLVAVLAGGCAAVWWFEGRRSTPVLPNISLEDCDTDVAEALRDVIEEVRSQPRSIDAWGRLGKALYAHNMLGEAEQAFAGAEQLDPLDPRWPYFQGVCNSRGDTDAALRHLQRALGRCRNKQDKTTVRLRLAEVCLLVGDTSEAKTQLDQLSDLNPLEEPRLRCYQGQLACQTGQWAEARTLLVPLADYPAARKQICGQLAMICNRLGAPDQAAHYLRLSETYEEDKGWFDDFLEETLGLGVGRVARFHGIRSKEQSEDLSVVIADLRRMEQEGKRQDYMVHFALGTNLGKSGRHEEAEVEFKRALALSPKSFRILDTLTHSQYSQAIRLKETGQLTAARAKLEEAAQSARQATKVGASDAWCHHRLALILVELERFPDALEPAQRSVAIRPEVAAMHTLLGSILAELGRQDEAMISLRRGVECARPGETHPSETLEKYRVRFTNKKN